MHNQSCRACGSSMNATVHCATCKESMVWECSACERLQDTTHKH